MKLVYIPKAGFECPGDGWPAADHDEPSESLAAQKIESGFYRDQNKREERITESASKREVNRKAKATRDAAITAADSRVAEASVAATETRREHGREK